MVCCSSSTIISCDFEHSQSSSVLHSHRRTSIQSQWHFHPVSYSTDHTDIDCRLGVLEPKEYTDHTLYNNTGFSQKWAELCGLTPQETCPHVSLESERGVCVCVCVCAFIKVNICPPISVHVMYASTTTPFHDLLCGHYLCMEQPLTLCRKTPGIVLTVEDMITHHTHTHSAHTDMLFNPCSVLSFSSSPRLLHTAHTVWLN